MFENILYLNDNFFCNFMFIIALVIKRDKIIQKLK